MRFYLLAQITIVGCCSLFSVASEAQQITTAGQPAQLDIRMAGENSIRITLKPVSMKDDFAFTPALAERTFPAPVISIREINVGIKRRVGGLNVEIQPAPLTVKVSNADGKEVQQIIFQEDGNVSFRKKAPILGMGEGGPRPPRGSDWRQLPIQFDRNGSIDSMQPRWQADAYGSRNPVAMLLGTEGWGLFVVSPWVYVDLRENERGYFIPWRAPENLAPQNQRNQQLNQGKGLPPVEKIIPGLFDIVVFDGGNPSKLIKDFSTITGPAAMPPKWALGYMQSHRTLIDDAHMVAIVDSFRNKQIPIDAVIYLGTGFAPRGWNKRQPSFEFNPDVFKREPSSVISDIHARNVKMVVHMVPWDRDRLPTLHGNIPPRRGEVLDASHVKNYWQQHVDLIRKGIDAFWPDEGDWFNLHERIKRHQLYYQGHLSSEPNIRPWSLQRNGYPGIAQWGGWVWSGDTESSWKTLEGQVAVGINYSLSIGPYWGSDIGGFYSNKELTGELYARWFQFASFCGSFRSHGRTWRTRLPWGWGLSYFGPIEDREPPLETELNNHTIEPIAKKYSELRYQLMPYTYTLAWEARNTGMPLMRAMWLHYQQDSLVRNMGTQYMWGRDLLIAPVFEKGAAVRKVYLPQGDWYDWWKNTRHTGGQVIERAVDLATMPIYVRAGAIIPFDPIRQYTSQPVTEPTTLKIYGGADGDFALYDDDGISQAYLYGDAALIRLKWNDQKKKLTIEPVHRQRQNDKYSRRVFKIELLPEGKVKQVKYIGKKMEVSL